MARWNRTRQVRPLPSQRPSFPRRYGSCDIARLAKVDSVHEDMSGPEVRRILQREYGVCGKAEFGRLAGLPVPHLYNLRRSLAYRHRRVRVQPTCGKAVSIAERASPIRILGFHSDNGSEYINHRVAEMLNKLLAEFERDLAASGIEEARARLEALGRRINGGIPFGFRWAADGVTRSVIATYVNSLGWIAGGGRPWTSRQALSILGNQVCAGMVIHGLAFRDGGHPALIDRDIYHKVQNWIAA